jgi:hypothetical protein
MEYGSNRVTSPFNVDSYGLRKDEEWFRYSNTLGWNTFPVPTLTEKNKADLTRCAEDILLAREAHFPATIADLYDPEKMPADLREAHERNDEVLERIYIGRRFRNDTERLEKLFDLYTAMSSDKKSPRDRTSLKTATWAGLSGTRKRTSLISASMESALKKPPQSSTVLCSHLKTKGTKAKLESEATVSLAALW